MFDVNAHWFNEHLLKLIKWNIGINVTLCATYADREGEKEREKERDEETQKQKWIKCFIIFGMLYLIWRA